MTLLFLAELAVAVIFAASVQTAVGFGFGLVLVPIVLALGCTLPEAVSLTLGAGLVQTLVGLRVVREEIRWEPAIPLAAVQWAALPVGIAAMEALHEAGPARVRQAVGAILLLVVTMRVLARPSSRDDLPRGWTFFAAATSGVLSGAVGMGGPPLVLLALSQRMSADRFRAFLWEQFLLVTPLQLLALALRFGSPVLASFGLGLALAPVLWMGTFAGRAISTRWEAASLGRLAITMLYLLAFASVVAPFVDATGG